jgi:hypothetical protein
MSSIPDVVRSLPPRPNLEFEHKEAKQLLKDLRDANPSALARARQHRPDVQEFKLADAQFIIAREYGFASWPKLVAYYRTWDLHSFVEARSSGHGPSWFQDEVRRAREAHAGRHWWVAPSLATYVPRCYGCTDEEVFDTPVTEDEVQLMIARRERFTSWEALLAGTPDPRHAFDGGEHSTLQRQALVAISEGNLDGLKSMLDANPELVREERAQRLQAAAASFPMGPTLTSNALLHELQKPTDTTRAITDYLVSVGGDLQTPLNQRLVGHMYATAEEFEYAIARGADPTWVPRNGISLIEHVMLRCWNPGPLDIIARYVKPRKAFWIAAGMDDVAELRTYFNRDGTLTDDARSDRADFTAVGMHMLNRAGADDREILWEAGVVATFNQRWKALDFLLERGLDIDFSPWRFNQLHWAVGNRRVAVVEHLVKRGANVDLKGWHPYSTAREMAAEHLVHNPNDPDVKRIFEVCESGAKR